ncbi:MAG: glutamate synthase subunit beta [Eubacteriales bacterium]|nr:glutamate synthase subunit beta [Eubacteriales bacterium]
MGKSTGFMEFKRENNPSEAPLERIRNFLEFHSQIDEEERRKQGARCMNCGLAFCQSGIEIGSSTTGCPLHNLIPEWNDELYNGQWDQALARLLKTNNFPEFTGRVCPALCESACTCGLYGSPVTVRENELSVIEKGFREGHMKADPPEVRSGKRVAVVGSGPSGLACADILNKRGHEVTVFERDDRPGGLLTYGIPNMKLDKSIVERRIHLMKEEGVIFKTGADIGNNLDAQTIIKDYDATVICCGSREPRDLKVPGRDAGGVLFAVDFLTDVTKKLLEARESGEEIDIKSMLNGKDVIIVGGGDTGNDCVGTCIRLGCKSVHQLVRKPEAPRERQADNPWPEVSKASKVDYGQEESLAVFGSDPRVYQTKIKEIIKDEDGHIKAVQTIMSEPEKNPDGTVITNERGKVSMVEVPGSEKVLPCDLLLLATGFSGCQSYIFDQFGVNTSKRGSIITKGQGSYATDVEKVFTAGDAHRGASLVVYAIAEGRACAKEVDEYLMGYTNLI